jgi:deoxyadenosine/deoxycytidine kinase
MVRISIEGNIAAGKTTVFESLEKEFPDSNFFREPVRQWGELLELYYEDREAWALPLNLKILLSFRESIKYDDAFIERSPVTCKNVFTQMLYKDETLSPRNWELFSEFYDVIGWSPDVMIYIDTPAAVCLERVHKRGTVYETASVDIQYLRRVEFHYETMIKKLELDGSPIKVVRVDGSVSPHELAKRVVDIARRMRGEAIKPRSA